MYCNLQKLSLLWKTTTFNTHTHFEAAMLNLIKTFQPSIDPQTPLRLNPIRQWLDTLEIRNRKLARFICRMIPAQCPFEQNFSLFGRISVRIPPLCKLNPLYEEIVGLRFRALCYLADEYNEIWG